MWLRELSAVPGVATYPIAETQLVSCDAARFFLENFTDGHLSPKHSSTFSSRLDFIDDARGGVDGFGNPAGLLGGEIALPGTHLERELEVHERAHDLRGAPAAEGSASLLHTAEDSFDGGLVGLEVLLALLGDGVELLIAFTGADGCV